MKQDVEKWGRMMYEAEALKQELGKDQFLRKSSSVPRMITDFELEEADSEMIIE
jgi:hypothetical protein